MRKIIPALFYLSMSFLLCNSLYAAPIKEWFQLSPDGQLQCWVRLNQNASLEYRLIYKKNIRMDWSALGLEGPGLSVMVSDILSVKATKSSTDELIQWPFGENKQIRNHYNSLLLKVTQASGFESELELRIFDRDLAIRYHLPNQKTGGGYAIVREKTDFRFPEDFSVYQHHIESPFSLVKIADLKNGTDIPAVLRFKDLYVAINEAANQNYTKAILGASDQPNTLSVQFGKDTVHCSDDFYSPWRTISISETAIGLCDHSALLYQLSPPAPKGNYDWIKPGKLIRDMTLSSEGAKACIDFAAKMNFQYIMFDAGWYGKGYAAEFDASSNPRNVVKAIDMPEVIRYGASKNIGLILYVNYVGLRKYNMDSSFTLYKSWGVKGLKFGFVNGLTQDGISWLMNALKKAQDYGFIVDVHDNYKPTGMSRSIPAFLTQEGVRGNENNPDAFHNTVLPFTRFLSGPADYTFCYRNQNDSFNNNLLSKKLQVSKAHQLALTVVFYSPIQSMLWYGRPADYQKPEEIEFFKYVPTVWDKTLHLSGEIGSYITVARKKDENWFIGSVAADKPSDQKIRLDFLDKGQAYTASIYEDDGKGGIKRTVLKMNSNSILDIHADPKGGQAVMIRKD